MRILISFLNSNWGVQNDERPFFLAIRESILYVGGRTNTLSFANNSQLTIWLCRSAL